MAVTYEKLAETVLSSATANVTLSSISASYEDLIVYIYGKSTYGGSYDDIYMRINGNSGSYNYGYMRATVGSGTLGAAVQYNQGNAIALIGGSNNFTFAKIIVPSYAKSGSPHYKKFVAMSYAANGSTAGKTEFYDNVHFGSTSAVSSLYFAVASGSWAAGTTFSLYGIKSAQEKK